MPEISICLFDLKFLFNLYPKEDKNLQQKLLEYEEQTQADMAENRVKLFQEFGYQQV